ncbi:MAG: hypothetical protein IJ054_06650 [Lachnospiraceae bacterium]|nr:hypothetical protein [Lachnospiraceae bacterium]
MEKNLIRNYKDTVFRMIFNDRKELLSLYNAVNNTDYKNADELEIVTLENAVYLSMKNDVSCVLDMRLQIYEQQSSINPNMPLRDLMYISKQYEKLIVGKDIYSSKLIRLPSPKFIVFYNGKDKQPEKKMLILSDAFEKKDEDINLELKVLQININKGYNEAIKKKCPKLFHYMSYVDEVRKNLETYPLEEAVPKAIDYCISNDILKDFLLANKAEVVSMSIFEYDEELHKKTLLQEGYEEGYDIGLSDGIEQGIEQGRKEAREEIERLKKLLAEKEEMLS